MTRPLRVLVLADYYRNTAATIRDHSRALEQLSRHQVVLLNPVGRPPPSWLDLASFDAVVIHFSVHTLYPAHLGAEWIRALAEFPGVKALFLQDEYRTIHAFHARMRELGISLLFTCVPEGEIEKVYPQEELPGLRCVNVLTGYVPDGLAALPLDLESPRSLDIGYRARDGAWWLGDLFREKVRIAEGFRARRGEHGMRCDISTREEDRLYGPAWTRFLQDSRFTLGTESGASVFDFTGAIQEAVQGYLEAHPEASYEEVHTRFLAEHEGRIRLNQISPRVWEATALGCGLVLFPGEYSGILEPDRHYIPLEKDFSNFEGVVARMRDEDARREMVARAHADLIASGRYSYRNLSTLFDRSLEEAVGNFEPPLPLPGRGALGATLASFRELARLLTAPGVGGLRPRIRNLYYAARSHPELLGGEWRLCRRGLPLDGGSPVDEFPEHPEG